MNKGYLKVWLLIFVSVFSAFHLAAQQNHFIYLQTENKQPFYLKLDKKILSSSASGYLIVPKLQEGNLSFAIGFPKNEWPEQYLSYTVSKKDEGFLLKAFGDKGWGLFNLQTMEVVMLGKKNTDNKEIVAAVKNETEQVVTPAVIPKDSVAKIPEPKVAIIEAPVPVPAEKPIKPEPAVVAADSPIVAKEVVKAEGTVKTPVIEIIKKEERPASATSQIKKLFSVTSSEGSDLVYADIVNGHADTIRLFVPAEKKNDVIVAQQEKKVQPVEEVVKKDEPKKIEPVIAEVTKSQKQETQKAEPVITEVSKPQKEEPAAKKATPKFIDIELSKQKSDTAGQIKPVREEEKDNKAVITPVEEKIKPAEVAAKPLITNSDCKNLASDEDFLKLRKKMAAGDKDDEMIEVAKKAFKSRCFSTEQVKNLSVLFLKDEGKYKFFDMVYPFVSDSYNFSSLQAQLSDEYFISRFKAMIRH